MSRWTAVRARAGTGLATLRNNSWAVGQCSVAAMLAWFIATWGLNHPQPLFAPVAAIVCLNVSPAARLRRMGELAIGVTIGVGIADVLVGWLGNGWWQIGLVVVLALGTAQLFGGGPLLTAQSGVQATFLAALPQPPGGGLHRWEDALVGGLCALAVAAFLPGDPARAVRSKAQTLIAELSGVVAAAAAALRSGDADLADATLERARGTQVEIERWTEALRGGEEISRISPLRRRQRDDLHRYRRALVGVDRAARNMRVAIRRIAAALDLGQSLPDPLADVLDDLSVTLSTLREEVGGRLDEGPMPAELSALAGRLDPVTLGARTMSAHVVVAQVRSAVVDLLGATGMDLVQARSLLPHGLPRPQAPAGE